MSNKMKFKILGLTWDLKPVLVFLWVSLAVILFGLFVAFAIDDKIIPALLCALACFIWTYITSTLEANGLMGDS